MAQARRNLLIVDDDATLRDSLVEQIALHEDIATVPAGSAEEARAAVAEQVFDAVLLDVGLPDMDGRDLCRVLRRQGLRCPVIMLTAADSDADAILGLESGANDYVTKPFRLGVLLARLRAHLRQHASSEDAVVPIAGYSFQPAQKLLVRQADGHKIRLTEKEAAVLKFLYRTGDQVVARDTLLGEVWGYNAQVSTHTLETHVYRLRQKIEANPQDPQILVTEAGGYRLYP